jgi:uncharacterized membrane protein YqjE
MALPGEQSATARGAGLFASLRRLGATGIAVARTRLDLLATELQEEKQRLLGMLAWGALAVIFLAAGLIFMAILFTVLLWDSNRLLALGVCSALFLGAGGVALTLTLNLARGGSRLFDASLAELERDQAELSPRRE